MRIAGAAVDLRAYRRVDGLAALAFVGADWGLRILANEGEEAEPEPGAEHLPAGWGTACLAVYDVSDIVTPELAAQWGQP